MSFQTDDDRSRTALRRREALIAAGGAGAGLAWALARGPAALAAAAARPAASCVLVREVMEGPYWIENRLRRRDIRDGRPGLPLILTLTIQDAATCRAIRGADVEVWHADAGGVYSGYTGAPPPGRDGHATPNNRKRFLRGHQRSDARGRATFVTIYPGWYPGRTIHIHFKVRTFERESETYEFTSQLFFDQATNDAVQGSPGYDGVADPGYTTNSGDAIYGGDAAVLVPLTGNIGNGFGGAITVGLTGIEDTRTGKGVKGRLRSLKVARGRDGRRRLVAEVAARERLEARLALFRGKRRLAARSETMRPGRRRIAVPFPRAVPGRKLAAVLELVDRDGGLRTIRRRVRVGPPPPPDD